MIRLAFKAVFWLTIVLLVLPSDPDGTSPSVTVMEILGAVRSAIADLSEFCVRNPGLCETGEAVAQALADKAAYGIEQIQEYLAQGADGTLTTADLADPWQAAAVDPQTVAAVR
jgi:hypothetical protein